MTKMKWTSIKLVLFWRLWVMDKTGWWPDWIFRLGFYENFPVENLWSFITEWRCFWGFAGPLTDLWLKYSISAELATCFDLRPSSSSSSSLFSSPSSLSTAGLFEASSPPLPVIGKGDIFWVGPLAKVRISSFSEVWYLRSRWGVPFDLISL